MSDSDTKHVVADTGYFTSFSGHIIHADSWMCWGWLKLDIILQEMDSVFHWYMNEIMFVIYLKYLESSCLRAKQSCNVRVLYCSRESVTWQHRLKIPKDCRYTNKPYQNVNISTNYDFWLRKLFKTSKNVDTTMHVSFDTVKFCLTKHFQD